MPLKGGSKVANACESLVKAGEVFSSWRCHFILISERTAAATAVDTHILSTFHSSHLQHACAWNCIHISRLHSKERWNKNIFCSRYVIENHFCLLVIAMTEFFCVFPEKQINIQSHIINEGRSEKSPRCLLPRSLSSSIGTDSTDFN